LEASTLLKSRKPFVTGVPKQPSCHRVFVSSSICTPTFVLSGWVGCVPSMKSSVIVLVV